jgi:diketogulonate reductase-like aldo/keto reductase
MGGLHLESSMDASDGLVSCSNEKEVGEGIRRAGVDREKLWITSKLWNNSQHPDYVHKALDKTINDLGVSYLDLYLMHWPSAFQPGGEMIPKVGGVAVRDTETTLAQTWAEMEKALDQGKVKNIGISNFTKSEVEELLQAAKHKPDVIQLELHPYLQQTAYVEWLQSQGIEVTAYSPFGNQNPIYGGGELLRDDPVIQEIAKIHGKTPNQILLSWGATRNTSVIPKSTNAGRIEENKVRPCSTLISMLPS